MDAPNPPA
jgi:C1A family cysteine protease